MSNIQKDIEAAITPPQLFIQDKKTALQIENILKDLVLTRQTIEKIKKTFEDEIENGLREEPSSLQMEKTYISELPDGTENGKFLAVDLGGTNFRVLLIELQDGAVVNDIFQKYNISDNLRQGPGADLFDHIALCVDHFLKKHKLADETIFLGFTFSFPMVYHALDSGILVNWTKSYKCQDVVGKDVALLLKQSFLKIGCSNVSVSAIINDATGTLMMGALEDKKTAIGLIIGTGSNACYYENSEKVRHWDNVKHGKKGVIIDTEWGAFGDNGVLNFIKTEFDVQMDKNLFLINSFTFEKYISGKYLGEIVRVILVKLVQEGFLFGGKLSPSLQKINNFHTAFMSSIEEDITKDKPSNTLGILDCLGVKNYTADDVKLLQYVCKIVINRSALLVAICLATLLDRIGKEEVTIAVDGSVIVKHPLYEQTLKKYMRVLTKKKFKFLRVADGSGKGAAVTVAIAKKLENRFKNS